MIKRKKEITSILGLLRQFPVVGIVGARQVGKTTIALEIGRSYKGPVHYFDLENPDDTARLSDPMLALKSLRGLVMIDESQRMPSLYPILRVLADDPKINRRFLILGSASPDLLRHSSESLAGRIAYHELGEFCVDETGIQTMERLWLRGGFPKSYLAKSLAQSDLWRRNFIKTFLEKDLPQMGITVRAETLRRFWHMIAHYHGQRWNSSEFARAFGLADTTVRHYLDILTGAFVVRQLPAWHENISKRQVKAPKIFIADTGILHSLLGIRDGLDLDRHPKIGASWEGFIAGQLIRVLKVSREDCFSWATHAGSELDLLIVRGRSRYGFEIKRTSSPSMTPSMHHALTDLKLVRLDIVHCGDKTFDLTKKVRAISARDLMTLKPLT
jgi:predicted AAA+ superfamily ATPase